MFRIGGLSTLLLVVAVIPLSWSFSIYRDRIPNGAHVPHPCKPNYMWRGVGHINALGAGERNAFGKDFLANGATWNPAVCQLDSDGDGLTNGQELGDPSCNWTQGALPTRVSHITHPGVCTPWNDTRCLQNNSWVDCDVDSLKCDALNNPDVKNVTLRFPSSPVPSKETNYVCMTFDLPGDDIYHLIATEPYIDNAQVMHHILVYGCEEENPPSLTKPTPCGMEATSGCSNLIGLWQVGSPGRCTNSNAGFLFGKGSYTRIKMEFHWNNPERHSGYTDSSGFRFFYTSKLRPNSAATMIMGQAYLEIPSRQPSVRVTGTCSAKCTRAIISKPLYVIEAVNHMHYLGKSGKLELFRNNTLVATLTNDEVYSYDSPVSHIHDPPVEILPGDEIVTTCEYNSQGKDTVTTYGDATSDEMCFTFLTVYPQEAIPITKNCVGYKEHSFCRKPISKPRPKVCDYSRFLNVSVPEMHTFVTQVYTQCQAFGPCTPACWAVMEPKLSDPCFQEPHFTLIKNFMLQDKESFLFLAQLMSCKSRPTCPECPRCPSNNGIYSNNNEGSTGKAAALLPGIVSLVTLLLTVFLYHGGQLC